jgi:hypothetical protein
VSAHRLQSHHTVETRSKIESVTEMHEREDFLVFAHLLTRCLRGEALTVENLSVVGHTQKLRGGVEHTPEIFFLRGFFFFFIARRAQPRTRWG